MSETVFLRFCMDTVIIVLFIACVFILCYSPVVKCQAIYFIRYSCSLSFLRIITASLFYLPIIAFVICERRTLGLVITIRYKDLLFLKAQSRGGFCVLIDGVR